MTGAAAHGGCAVMVAWRSVLPRKLRWLTNRMGPRTAVSCQGHLQHSGCGPPVTMAWSGYPRRAVGPRGWTDRAGPGARRCRAADIAGGGHRAAGSPCVLGALRFGPRPQACSPDGDRTAGPAMLLQVALVVLLSPVNADAGVISVTICRLTDCCAASRDVIAASCWPASW